MGAAAISLRLSGEGGSAAYEFTCPECQSEISKRANRKTVALLVAAGVEVDRLHEGPSPDHPSRWELPEMPPLPTPDMSPQPDAPVFTADDVIAFHFVLENDEAIDRFLLQDR